MKEKVVIKYFLVLVMLFMSGLSFYEITQGRNESNPFEDYLYRTILFLAGSFFLYQSIWILRIKTK